MFEKETFTLAHISDLHMCSLQELKVPEIINKRLLGYLSWRLHRSAVHRDEVLTALLRDLDFLNPDHIVITGDLTHLGTAGQFHMAQKFLRTLGPPAKITVIPGNHDAYVKTGWDQSFAYWSEYMASDQELSRSKAQTNCRIEFPSLRLRGQAALIGVCSARPSSPFFAVGSVGRAQLQRLEKMLDELGRRHLYRIILIHHPPAHGVVGWRKRLTDAAAFRAVLKRCGAELVLHGHVHRSSLTYLRTPAGRIASISVASASALSQKPERLARYHVYHLNQNSQGWVMLLSVRGYAIKENRFIAKGEPGPLSPSALS